MTKPKSGLVMDFYKAGLRDGEKRLARALRRWAIKEGQTSPFLRNCIMMWLSARLKERK